MDPNSIPRHHARLGAAEDVCDVLKDMLLSGDMNYNTLEALLNEWEKIRADSSLQAYYATLSPIAADIARSVDKRIINEEGR